MIWSYLLDAVYNVVVASLDSFGLGSVEWFTDTSALNAFFVFVRIVCYFFPMDTLLSIFGIIVAFSVFRIAIRLIKTIWELLPFI